MGRGSTAGSKVGVGVLDHCDAQSRHCYAQSRAGLQLLSEQSRPLVEFAHGCCLPGRDFYILPIFSPPFTSPVVESYLGYCRS